MRAVIRRGIDSVVGSPPVTALSRQISRGRLRILGYHGIEDSSTFAAQMEHIAHRYSPVTADMVERWAHDDLPLPHRAVWVTFDDGDPSVVDLGLPVLQHHGIEPTMFICPGVVDTDQPFWWQTVEQAIDLGLTSDRDQLGADPVAALKTVEDHRRREAVATYAARIEEATGSPPRIAQITSTALRRFLEAGGQIGNHTVDHPLLDHTPGEDQTRQISEAHRWIEEHLGFTPRLFAYPNGNTTDASIDTLRTLGYRVGVRFDHRLADVGDALLLSRVRTNGHDSLSRFRASVSGAHPLLQELRRRIGR